MGRSGPTFRLLLLVLVVLRGRAGAAVSDFHFLRYELNITSNNQPRCMGQGRVDRMDLLLCDCDNDEVEYMNNMLKGTETLEHMTHKLKEMGDLMRGKLPDITPENYTRRAPPTLQVGLMCQCDASGSCSGSLELGFDGQRFLVFDSENGEYKADNPRGELMKEKCKNDKEVTKYFQVFLKGDCKEWLKFLVPRKKALETTAAPTMAPGPATPPTVSATPTTATTTVPAPSKDMNSQNNTAGISPVIFILLIPYGILGCVLYCDSRRCCSKAPESVV